MIILVIMAILQILWWVILAGVAVVMIIGLFELFNILFGEHSEY